MSILTTLLNWLSGGLLDKLLDHAARREKMRLEAMNDERRQLYADRRDARATAKEIRLATAGFWEMRTLTVLIALPFIVHLWAVGLDTVFKFGWAIDKWPPPFDRWEGQILLSFFGVAGLSVGIRSMAGAMAYVKRRR